MTDTVADVASPLQPPADDPVAGETSTRRSRILLLVAAIASVVPFFWAAIRDARNGFYPTLDVAATIIRARATFSAHPPLYGMWSSGSSWAGHEIHFPGPILLYLLAVPVHLLGNSWGTLLGFLLLNAFTWSIGSENLIDARPMEMVTIPFLCFLLLVWLVTSGEFDALPALAVTANYLFLNHLVMALQVPVIGMCAVVGVVLWIRRERARRGSPDTDPDPGPFRRFRRRLLQTGAITFVMWLPTLIQQFTNNPGNLTLLLSASGQHREPVGSYVVGYNATIRLIAKPTFWFRGRFDDPDFPFGLQNLTLGDVLAGIIVAGLIGVLGWVAWRRRDRASLAALSVSVIAILISIETVTQAPAVWGFPLQYLRSLWCLAAFVWFAVLFSAYRLLAPHFQWHAARMAGVGAIVFAVLGLSYANYGSATDMANSPHARTLVDQVVHKLTDRGPIYVVAGPDFTSQRYFSSLLLGLDTAGVRFCVDPHTAQQYGRHHDCAARADVRVYIEAPRPPDGDEGKLIAKIPLLTDDEKAELAASERVVEDWLADHHRIELTPEAQRLVDEGTAEWRRTIDELLAPADGDLSGLLQSEQFRLLIGMEASARARDGGAPSLVADPDAPIAEMRRYFELTDASLHGNIWVYERRRS